MQASEHIPTPPSYCPPHSTDVPTPLPDNLRKAIATYEAGKALMAYITPEFEEVVRVSLGPLVKKQEKEGKKLSGL